MTLYNCTSKGRIGRESSIVTLDSRVYTSVTPLDKTQFQLGSETGVETRDPFSVDRSHLMTILSTFTVESVPEIDNLDDPYYMQYYLQ